MKKQKTPLKKLQCCYRRLALKPVRHVAIATMVAGVIFGTPVCEMAQATQPGAVLSRVIYSQASLDAKTVRAEAAKWLRLSRQALAEGNIALARNYVVRAEQLNPQYDALTVRFEDTPQKVRNAIAASETQQERPSQLNVNSELPPADPYTTQTEAAASQVQLPVSRKNGLVEVRKVLASGNWQLAGQLVGQAKNEGFVTGPNGDSLEKVESLVRNAEYFAKNAQLRADPQKFNGMLARFLLDQANGLMQYGELEVAEKLVRQASTMPVQYQQFEQTPDVLLAKIQNAKAVKKPVQLQIGENGAKQQVLKLLSIARTALDRGDYSAASQFVAQAESLQVPDEAFVGNEPRPWQFRLELARLQRQGNVALGVFNPVNDNTNVRVANANGGNTERQFAGNEQAGAEAQRLYSEGIAALQQQDQRGALAKFQEAWKFQSNLDPAFRTELQDKIRLVSAVVIPVAPAVDANNPLNQIDARQNLVRQQLFSQIMVEQKLADELAKDDPKGALEKLLGLRGQVEAAELDQSNKRRLLAIVDRNITSLENYLDANIVDIELDEENQATLARIRTEQKELQGSRDQIASLVDQFNTLLDERRYAEAEVIAKQAREIAPNESVVKNMEWKSRFARRHASIDTFQNQYEQATYDALDDVDRSKLPMDTRRPFQFGDSQDWGNLTASRRKMMERNGTHLSPAGMKIQQALLEPVDVNFENQPLGVVLDTLARMTGVNVHIDRAGLNAEGVASETPVSIALSQPVSLRSALNLILEELRLSYVIRNEVLLITSEQARDTDVYQEVYNVADLVIGIPNFVPGFNVGLPSAIRDAHDVMAPQGFGAMNGAASMPLTMASTDLLPGQPNTSVLSQMPLDDLLPGASSLGNNPTITPGGQGGAAMADFETLMSLIKDTIQPDTWDDMGGAGTITPFPGNLSLVVSATQQVHEEIRDLLEQLRKSQDLQVTIEVRMITLTDNFFERIGVDFDFEIDDNVDPSQIQDDSGNSVMFGMDSQGPTVDLDMVFDQNDAYNSAIPMFGAYDAGTAAQFGFAILSDIEVFFLLEVAQGDTRSNVLTAPKVTLFNGQTASVSDLSQRPFVTGLSPVVGDFAVAHQPIIVVLGEGTTMSVQAVVSNDKRFVRLTMVPFFSRIGEVEEFTFDGETTTSSGETVLDPDGNPVNRDNAVTTTRGTTVQLPTFNFTSVSTTVSVPDGGTVLLGGIKRLAEGRSERGIPILAQLPYISRLFKNVGIGRDTESLMMMVTPRIIIQEEEEKRQTGINADDL